MELEDINDWLEDEPVKLPELVNTAHANIYVMAVKANGRKIDKLKQQAKEAQEFYAQKVTKIEENILWIKEQLKQFLITTGEKSFSLPAGTVFKQTRKTITLPDDDILLEWLKEHATNDEYFALATTVPKVNKKEVKAFLEHYPYAHTLPGYTSSFIESITIRGATDNATE